MAMTNEAVATLQKEVVLTRVFNAPRALVFKLWTDAAHVAKWWGPQGFTNPRCEIDARPGGRIVIDMRGPDGVVYPMTGTYRDVVVPERLSFTSAALDTAAKPLFETLTTVIFAERDGKTTQTVRAEVLWMNDDAAPYIAGMKEGWTQTIERLAAHVNATSGAMIMNESIKSPTISDREIVIRREFDAPRALVWKAWTDPQHIDRWWGPRGFRNATIAMDVRVGGMWRFTIHGPDGTDWPNRIVYREIVEPERLVYDHGSDVDDDPRPFPVSVTFAAEGRKTQV